MKNLLKKIATLLMLTFSIASYGQTDVLVQGKDSLNNIVLHELNQKLAEVEQQRIADSIKKAELYTREAGKQAFVYSNLHHNIQDVFIERGIEILSPHYRAVRDGNLTTIPAYYLPNDYKAPNFNVNLDDKDGK